MFNININQAFSIVNSKKTGLTTTDASERLKNNGPNKLAEAKKKHIIVKFLEQFKDLLIIILLFSAALSVTIALIEKSYAEIIDAIIIAVIVVTNAIIGLVQESKADKAMEALKNMTKPYAKVLRNGKALKVKTEKIVVGDVVILEAGDIVPADLRLFENASLKIEESALTGESVRSEKDLAVINKTTVPLGDQLNMAFMGSVVTYGRGKGVVVATGMNTQMGKIAGELVHATTERTPLQKRIHKTSKAISLIVIIISAFIFAMGVIRGDSITHSFMLAVAIAVCCIPEGLPATLTVALSIGVEEMSKKRAIIKKLPAVETLGSTQVICSDKTGTLTLNKMTVQQVYVKGLPNYLETLKSSDKLQPQKFAELRKNKNFVELMTCMLLCNDTQLKYENETLSTIGDPTETALAHYGFINNLYKDKLDGAYPRVSEIPFDSDRKLMTTIHDKEGFLYSYTKGAIDSILPACSHILDNGKIREITNKDIKEILEVNHEYGSHAQRILGFAFKELQDIKKKKTAEKNMIFVGLCGMIDPPREEVFEAIKTCKKAGILTIMITGDHKDTAFAIAKQLGIATSDSQVITGVELDGLTDEELINEVNVFRVYARVNPEHKVRIVKAFKAQNKIVAMTGDGVNDAPSIKAADIGIGMGISGTDVTKGVADMILTDDNFATIVSAVKEGRKVYNNILKIIQFLLTTSIAEVILMITIFAFLGRPFFTPVLILYINFVSDTLIALALGTEKAEENIMNKKPYQESGNMLFSKTGFNVFYMSAVQSIIIFALYFLSLEAWHYSNEVTITMCFITLVCMELFHSYNLRSEFNSIFKIGVFTNKYLNYAFLISFILTTFVVLIPNNFLHNILGIVDLNLTQWAISMAFAIIIIPVVEIIKFFIRHYSNKKERATIKLNT